MNDNELKKIWEQTLGQDEENWSTLSAGATYKPAEEHLPETLSGQTLPSATLSGGDTVSDGTVSDGGTLIGDGIAQMSGGATDTAQYDILSEIGRGGMGVIYRARQGSLRRDVAIKQIIPEQANENAKGKFVSEALVTGVLDHPNIVPVHELGQTADGNVFLSMKLVGGTEWKDLLHPKTDDEKSKAAEHDEQSHISILLNVCNAIAFAHSKGIVHRDLKPENVMVGEFGEVLVMDWGIAVDISEQKSDDARAQHKSTVKGPSGTPSYMPPELAEGRGSDIGPWTDVYLLGAMLHEVLTGAPPHLGNNLMAVLLAASKSEPKIYPASVPAGLQAICHKAMARDRDARYESVDAFRAAVEDYLQHRESALITDTADEELSALPREVGSDQQNDIYGRYAKVVARYEQALELWSANGRAETGARQAREAYAHLALAGGDLGLAEAQAAPLPADEKANALRAEITAAQAARQKAAAAAKRMRLGLLAALVLIIAGLGIGIMLVSNEQAKTAEQRDNAKKAEQKATEQEGIAKQQRDEAQLAGWKAATLASNAIAKERPTIAQAESALALRVAREIHPDLAPQSAGQNIRGLAHDAWLRYAYTEPMKKPVWNVATPGAVRALFADKQGIVVFAEHGPLFVLNPVNGQIQYSLAGSDAEKIQSGHINMSSNGKFLVANQRDEHGTARLKVWNVSDGTLVHQFKEGFRNGLCALNSDGTYVIVARDNAWNSQRPLRLYRLADGKELSLPTMQRVGASGGEFSGIMSRLQVEGVVLNADGTVNKYSSVHMVEEGISTSIWASASQNHEVRSTQIDCGTLVRTGGLGNLSMLDNRRHWYRQHGGTTQLQTPDLSVQERMGLIAQNGVGKDRWLAPVASCTAWDRWRNGDGQHWAVLADQEGRVHCFSLDPDITESRETLKIAEGSINRGWHLQSGHLLTLVETMDEIMVMWCMDLTTEKLLWSEPLFNTVIDAAVSPSEEWMAVAHRDEYKTRADREAAQFGGGDMTGSLTFVRLQTGECIDVQLNDKPLVAADTLAWSDDSRLCLVAHGKKVSGLHVAAPAAATSVFTFQHSCAVQSLVWHNDGLIIIDETGAGFLVGQDGAVLKTLKAGAGLRRIVRTETKFYALDVDGRIWRYDADCMARGRIESFQTYNTARIQASQDGVVLQVADQLINPNDGSILAKDLYGFVLSVDRRSAWAVRTDYDEGGVLIRQRHFIADGVPADLPPLQGNETTWDTAEENEVFHINEEGPWAGTVTPKGQFSTGIK